MECCRSSHQTAAPATHHLPLNQMLFAFELSLTELSLIVHVPGTGVIQVEIDDLLKRISPKLHGNLKPLLVVLSDDMVKKKVFTKAASKSSVAKDGGTSGSESSGSFKSPGSVVSRTLKRGASSEALSEPSSKSKSKSRP